MWALIMIAGVAWIVLVGWFLAGFLDFADTASESGTISDLNTGQLIVAIGSALVFAAPGIGALVVGWRKRPRRG